MEKQRLIMELVSIVGREWVISNSEDLLVFEYDGSLGRGLPDIVVFPSTVDEVSRIMRLTHREGIPVVPRGAGTGLSGGSVPEAGGVVLALTRMKRILEIDPVNRLAVVEPGVVNIDLTRAASKYGLHYVPDPSSQRACTIGGNVAENAGGPHCLAYGVTTNHVLGLEVVLSNGDVVWVGGKAQFKPGYDLTGVMVGSEGTLGVVTKIIARLMPDPEAVETLLSIFRDMDDAARAVSSIIAHGIIPAALEMMDRLTIQAVEPAIHAGYPSDAGAVLLIEVEGLKEEAQEEANAIEVICRAERAMEVRRAKDVQERERLWAGRKNAIGAIGRLSPNYYILDGVVPRTRLVEVLRKVGAIGERFGFKICNVFHAGDGNIHPNILFNARAPGETQRVLRAGAEILQVCVEAGGSITGEHGVGLEKREFMPWVFNRDDLEAMARLRVAFAQGAPLNPGKIFPTGKIRSE